MGRPKGSQNKAVVKAQGAEATKEIIEAAPIKVSETVVEVSATKVVEVEVKPEEPKPTEMRGGFLAKVDNTEVYWSKSVLDTAFKRNTHNIEIPKGSSYIPPVDTKCENCG